MKKIVRLTESELHRIVKEAVKSVINETSDLRLTNAMDAAEDKVANYKELYGSGSIPHAEAQRQRDYFRDAYNDRLKNANDRRRANLQKMVIANRNRREGTTGGERDREWLDRQKAINMQNQKNKGILSRIFGGRR